MASVNKVILLGNLGADPEIRYLPSGDAVASIRLATTSRSKDKSSGEMREFTEWHRVSFFGRLAEIVGEYLKKGSSVYVEGQIRTRKWQDQSGQDRYSTDIVADSMQMLGSRSSGGGQSPSEGGYAQDNQQSAPRANNTRSTYAPAADRAPSSTSAPGGGFDDMEDDVPF